MKTQVTKAISLNKEAFVEKLLPNEENPHQILTIEETKSGFQDSTVWIVQYAGGIDRRRARRKKVPSVVLHRASYGRDGLPRNFVPEATQDLIDFAQELKEERNEKIEWMRKREREASDLQKKRLDQWNAHRDEIIGSGIFTYDDDLKALDPWQRLSFSPFADIEKSEEGLVINYRGRKLPLKAVSLIAETEAAFMKRLDYLESL